MSESDPGRRPVCDACGENLPIVCERCVGDIRDSGYDEGEAKAKHKMAKLCAQRDKYKQELANESMAARGREVELEAKLNKTRSAADAALDQEIALRESAERQRDKLLNTLKTLYGSHQFVYDDDGGDEYNCNCEGCKLAEAAIRKAEEA